MLRLIIILGEYVPYIEYIKGEKNTLAYALSILTINRNQDTTQESTYKNEIVSKVNDTEELADGILPMTLKLIVHYQQKYPILKAKYNMGT